MKRRTDLATTLIFSRLTELINLGSQDFLASELVFRRFKLTISAIQCPPLLIQDHRLSVTVTSYKFGGIAKYSCVDGYELNGTDTLFCTSNGKWSNNPSICEPIQCPLPLKLNNGHVVESPTSNQRKTYRDGDIVIYSCNIGFMLTGSDFIICQKSGKWSRLLSKCQPYCKYPGKPNNGDSTTEKRDYYLEGDKIVYYCTKYDYKLSGENVLECLNNGKWSRPIPKCIKPRKYQ